MAGLDYRVSVESGSLTVHTHSLSWHRARSPNITVPPAGQGWDRSGPVRVVAAGQGVHFKPASHGQRGEQMAAPATADTTE